MATRQKKSRARIVRLRPKRLLQWILSAGFVVTVSLWAFLSFHAFQKYSDQWQVPPVKLLLHSPQYLSPNEDEEIRFAVENTQDSAVNVVFQLVNDGPLLGFLGHETNVFYLGPVQSRGQINRQLKVFFPMATNMPGKTAGLSLWGSISDKPIQKIADLPIGIAPVPWTKSLSSYLGISLAGLVLGLFKNLLDRVAGSDKKTK